MLSKEKFLKYLDQICELSNTQDEINKITKGYDLLDINITLHEGLVIKLLAETMDDEGEWIEFWFYELEQGKRDAEVTFEEKPIPLKTKEDLYNLLVGSY